MTKRKRWGDTERVRALEKLVKTARAQKLLFVQKARKQLVVEPRSEKRGRPAKRR